VFITSMRRLLFLTVVLALTTAPAGAETVDRSRDLWATVNICDTPQSPDTLGVRASMPGSTRKGERMYMRFRAQFFSDTDNRWHNFTTAGTDSGFVPVGSARYRARQSGWTFPFELAPGQRYELRGVVNFEWRKGRRVVRRAVKRTTSGRKPDVAEPKGYSAATCVIKG
jgi:hypothetical protein